MRSALLLLGPWLVACAGDIGDMVDDPPGGEPTTNRPSTRPSAGGGGGTTGSGGAGGGTTPAPAAACKAGEKPPLPRARVWRLSHVQYANTVKRLFGVDVSPTTLPADAVSDDNITRFDTHSEKNLVTDRLAGLYRDHAAAIASTLLSKLGGTPHACVLAAGAADPCVQGFVRDFGGKAYRRPLAAAELDRLVAFYKTQRTQHDPSAAARMVLEALLQSPHFLYRFELGTAATGAKVPLTPHELAAQLSYYLADLPPDETLLAAADRNELSTPAAVRAHAERLLGTPSARLKLQAFFRDYMLLGELEDKVKDPKKFPTFTDALKKALVTETLTFVEKALFDNQGTLDTLFSAGYSYQNATVAKHYGLTAAGADYTRVALPPERTGLLSHAAVLGTLSGEGDTSPVHRGVFYFHGLLCRQLPVPPANASSMPEKLRDPSNATPTQRELWEYVQKTAPECAGCHGLFQPLGLSLEAFDPVGRYRESEFGKRLDTAVAVSGLGADIDGSYKNGLELARAVVVSKAGRECFTLQYATHAFGRTIDPGSEGCWIESLGRRFQDRGLGVQALLLEMTQDESFYFRSYP